MNAVEIAEAMSELCIPNSRYLSDDLRALLLPAPPVNQAARPYQLFNTPRIRHPPATDIPH